MIRLNDFMWKNYGVHIKDADIPKLKEVIDKELNYKNHRSLYIIKDEVEAYFSINLSRRTRKRIYVDARDMYINLARLQGYTLKKIGKILGGMDSSSVMAAQSRHHDKIKYVPEYRRKFKSLQEFIQHQENPQ